MLLKEFVISIKNIAAPLYETLFLVGVVFIIIGLYKIIFKNTNDIDKKAAKKCITCGLASFLAIIIIVGTITFISPLVGIGLLGDIPYEPPVKKTGEYNKISYNASLKTRDMQSVYDKTNKLVLVAGGRVFIARQAEDYSRIGFIVSRSNFDSFKKDIKKLVSEKLYAENINEISSPDKKRLELQQTDNLEIVMGYIEILHLSMWNMAIIYLPVHPAIIISILLFSTIAWFMYSKYKKDKRHREMHPESANITTNSTGFFRDMTVGLFFLMLLIAFPILFFINSY